MYIKTRIHVHEHWMLSIYILCNVHNLIVINGIIEIIYCGSNITSYQEEKEQVSHFCLHVLVFV